MRLLWWRKKSEKDHTEDIKMDALKKLQEAQKLQRDVSGIVRRGQELQRRDGFTTDIERALGGLWNKS